MADDDSTRSWDDAADDWVAHADTNDYRLLFLMPRTLALLGDVRGRRILDLGCGEGGYARELARRGADVVAVDGSERLVTIARRRAAELPIQHLCRNANQLDGVNDADFDLVLATMSLMDVGDYPGAIREAHRVLRPGGELVMSITHPCFTPLGARWLPDRSAYLVDRYFERASEPEKITARFRVPVLRHHRPLEDFIAAPLAAGFALTRFEEPKPTPEELTRSPRFERLLRIPYFLFLGWRKRPT